MQCNVGKCEIIHFGSNNRKSDYYLNRCKAREVDTQRDIGVLMHQSLNVSAQVQPAIKKE